MAKGDAERNYAGMTKEQQVDAIQNARSADELARIWAQLEPLGYSREGMVYAAVLERRAALGEKLNETDQAAVTLATQRRAAGAAMAPISGQLRGGE